MIDVTGDPARWKNLSDAAKWISEGRAVEFRPIVAGAEIEWETLAARDHDIGPHALYAHLEYRLKPEPPKLREFLIWVDEYGEVRGEAPKNHAGWKLIHVRETMKADG